MHEFQLPDMTCGHCASTVGQTLKLADPSCRFEVDLSQKKVQVQSSESRDTLAEALAEAGYPPV